MQELTCFWSAISPEMRSVMRLLIVSKEVVAYIDLLHVVSVWVTSPLVSDVQSCLDNVFHSPSRACLF